MKYIYMAGAMFSVDEGSLNFVDAEKSIKTDYCHGNACNDMEMKWDDDTRSYHLFNEGDEKVKVVLEGANYLGCNGVIKSKTMGPGSEWDSKSLSVCRYDANYK